MRQTFIFDIDGTLCGISPSRRKHIKTRDWDSFYKEASDEPAIISTVRIAQALASRTENVIVMVTGRPEEQRAATTQWLKKHSIPAHRLFMRGVEDRRRSFEVKAEHLRELIESDMNPIAVFDDREQDVDMYTEAGLCCYHIK